MSKHLGKVALMTAAVLWASCSDAKEEKADKPIAEKSETAQTRPVDTVLDTSPKCLYGTCGSGNSATQPKSEMIIPRVSEVEISSEFSDAKPLILKAIRIRTPGLRHIFNKYRKIKTDFEGTLVLKLNIETLGIVSDVSVKSTTTNYPEFDAEIVKAVSRWKFPKSKTGGSITIPFTFQESK